MFKNRTLELSVVKKPKNDDVVDDVADDYDRAVIISAGVSNALFQVTKLVTAYVVLDTVRKVAVNRLSK